MSVSQVSNFYALHHQEKKETNNAYSHLFSFTIHLIASLMIKRLFQNEHIRNHLNLFFLQGYAYYHKSDLIAYFNIFSDFLFRISFPR